MLAPIPARRFACGMLVAAAVGVVSAAAAAAFPLRAPQVVFDPTPLQAWMFSADRGIDVLTDQLDAEQFAFADLGCSSTSAFAVLSLSDGTSVGFYDTRAGTPPAGTSMFQLFGAGSAAPSMCAIRRSASGELAVFQFDAFGVYQGETVFPNVPADQLGLYVSGSGGTWFSQDARNGGAAHVLTYAGTSVNFGEYFMCAETAAVAPPALGTFTGVVVRFERLCGDPVRTSTWGQLKSIYR